MQHVHQRLAFTVAKDQEHQFPERGTMARTPNYNFERQERERLKKLKNAERAQAKLKPAVAESEAAVSDEDPGQG